MTNKPEPEQIFLFQRSMLILKIPMVRNSEGNWEQGDSMDAETTYDEVIEEWFEDENGVRLEMEEQI